MTTLLVSGSRRPWRSIANGNSCARITAKAPRCRRRRTEAPQDRGLRRFARHAARIRLNFHFRLAVYWTVGMPTRNSFSMRALSSRAATSVNFGSEHSKRFMTLPVLSAPARKRLRSAAMFSMVPRREPDMGCRLLPREVTPVMVDTKLVAQSQVDSNGFYYIWRST